MNASEIEVTRLFEKFGTVQSVKIIMDKNSRQSKGFGFVEMEEPGSALKAMSALNNINYMNQYIEVSEALSSQTSWL